MSKKQRRMVSQALKRFGRIYPCGNCATFSRCFSIEDGQWIFWFNTPDGSTHVEIRHNGNSSASME